MAEKIYKFEYDCGRMGDLEGLFIADESDVQQLTGKIISFGEVLGKHSDIEVKIDDSVLEEITDDVDFIENVKKYFGITHTISGYNPFDYWEVG